MNNEVNSHTAISEDVVAQAITSSARTFIGGAPVSAPTWPMFVLHAIVRQQMLLFSSAPISQNR